MTPPSPVVMNDSDPMKGTLRSGSSTSPFLDTPVPISKRIHTLLELLSSEKTYASDLAIIQDIHLKTALGQPLASLPSSNVSLPSGPFDTSNTSSSPLPMTVDDAKIIFNNIGDLVTFSDGFTILLEEALGNVLDGGIGEDYVGAVFLEMVPKMKPIYTQYITKHPAALERLNALPQTPSLAHYLSRTRELSQHLTHAWDLPSLLIKPVQRLSNYSLLLSAIIDETPESHPDKSKLKEAKVKMEGVAFDINEGRRRREVVKEVLTTGSAVSLNARKETKPKRKGLGMGIAVTASLARMKSTTSPSALRAKEGMDANAEAIAVAEMSRRLKAYDEAIRDYAMDVVKWSESVKILAGSLHDWTFSFGKLVGLDENHRSAAYDAFVEVIEKGILLACDALSEKTEKQLLVQLSKLKETVLAPERLLEAMYTLEPLHYGLLNTDVAKNRPTPSLLDASRSYVALRGQLFAELPRYLQLLEKGVHFTVVELTEWQTLFWSDIWGQWEELWNSLKLEAEDYGNGEETIKNWKRRHEEILRQFEGLNTVQPPRQTRSEIDITQRTQKGHSWPKSHSFEHASALDQTVVNSAMHSSLDLYLHRPLTPAYGPPSTHSQDDDPSPKRRVSGESYRSKNSSTSTQSRQHRRTPNNSSVALYQQNDSSSSFLSMIFPSLSPTKQAYNPAKNMPISPPIRRRRSKSQGKLVDPIDRKAIVQNNTAHYNDPVDEKGEERGREIGKSNSHRRLPETTRPNSAPPTRIHRPPSGSPPPQTSKPNAVISYHPTLSCYVVVDCKLLEGVQYYGIPFHTLVVGDVYEVLQNCGHPREHKGFPLHVDEEEECLLLVKNLEGDVGWALASFVLPTDGAGSSFEKHRSNENTRSEKAENSTKSSKYEDIRSSTSTVPSKEAQATTVAIDLGPEVIDSQILFWVLGNRMSDRTLTEKEARTFIDAIAQLFDLLDTETTMYHFIQLIFDIRRDKTLKIKTPNSESSVTLAEYLLDAGEMRMIQHLQMAFGGKNSATGLSVPHIIDASVLEAIRLKVRVQVGSDTRSWLRQLMLQIAKTYDIYPTTLRIIGVTHDVYSVNCGSFGDIYKGVYKEQAVALKRLRVFLNLPHSRIAQIKKDLCRETLIWWNHRHPYVLPLLGICDPDDAYVFAPYMVTPWMEQGNIHNIVIDMISFQKQDVQKIQYDVHNWLKQICSGLSYLHDDEGIVHGDLCGHNILINDKGDACIGDFGLAVFADKWSLCPTSQHAGNPSWQAPELCNNSVRPTYQSDVYSVACICLELYIGDTPNVKQVLCDGESNRPKFHMKIAIPDILWDTMKSCWAISPSTRPTARDLTADSIWMISATM
ncbi:hypothetical protein QCA50_005311 [Cerrena zonata]|uniref:Non-specific serine/threonine protein kinase n=1 Tax=Cerrena zonata TaxID=2478898 RepID=A0AAW0GQR5_9APHY